MTVKQCFVTLLSCKSVLATLSFQKDYEPWLDHDHKLIRDNDYVEVDENPPLGPTDNAHFNNTILKPLVGRYLEGKTVPKGIQERFKFLRKKTTASNGAFRNEIAKFIVRAGNQISKHNGEDDLETNQTYFAINEEAKKLVDLSDIDQDLLKDLNEVRNKIEIEVHARRDNKVCDRRKDKFLNAVDVIIKHACRTDINIEDFRFAVEDFVYDAATKLECLPKRTPTCHPDRVELLRAKMNTLLGQFREQILSILKDYEQVLPKGSFVLDLDSSPEEPASESKPNCAAPERDFLELPAPAHRSRSGSNASVGSDRPSLPGSIAQPGAEVSTSDVESNVTNESVPAPIEPQSRFKEILKRLENSQNPKVKKILSRKKFLPFHDPNKKKLKIWLKQNFRRRKRKDADTEDPSTRKPERHPRAARVARRKTRQLI